MRNHPGNHPAPVIRGLAQGDEVTVEEVFNALTPHQRQQRFHVAVPHLPASIRRRLADVDGHDRVALVVEVGGRPVALGSYVRVGLATAEVALAVAAAYTGMGIGTTLLDALTWHARVAGIEHFAFEVTATNRPVLHIARSRGALMERAGSVVHGSLGLGELVHVRRTA